MLTMLAFIMKMLLLLMAIVMLAMSGSRRIILEPLWRLHLGCGVVGVGASILSACDMVYVSVLLAFDASCVSTHDVVAFGVSRTRLDISKTPTIIPLLTLSI